MRVVRRDGLYQGSHVPGPSHNYLGLKVSPGALVPFEVAVLPGKGACCGAPLTAGEVAGWIAEGAEAAMAEAGASYRITYAQIVADDSRRPEVYRELARRIILRAHEDGKSKGDCDA